MAPSILATEVGVRLWLHRLALDGLGGGFGVSCLAWWLAASLFNGNAEAPGGLVMPCLFARGQVVP